MNVVCPECRTVYRVDPAKVPARGVRARCVRCPGEFQVEREVASSRSGVSEQLAESRILDAVAPPSAFASGGLSPTTSHTSEPVAAGTAFNEDDAFGDEAAMGQGASAARIASVGEDPTETAGNSRSGMASSSAADGSSRVAPVESPPALPVEVSGEEPPLPPPPFGSADPRVRARRLARALVSDMVVYNSDRRERSLQNGTLRQEFREEIRKSWEEYVSQVGNEIARETSYFQEALNEILAGGARQF